MTALLLCLIYLRFDLNSVCLSFLLICSLDKPSYTITILLEGMSHETVPKPPRGQELSLPVNVSIVLFSPFYYSSVCCYFCRILQLCPSDNTNYEGIVILFSILVVPFLYSLSVIV